MRRDVYILCVRSRSGRDQAMSDRLVMSRRPSRLREALRGVVALKKRACWSLQTSFDCHKHKVQLRTSHAEAVNGKQRVRSPIVLPMQYADDILDTVMCRLLCLVNPDTRCCMQMETLHSEARRVKTSAPFSVMSIWCSNCAERALLYRPNIQSVYQEAKREPFTHLCCECPSVVPYVSS